MGFMDFCHVVLKNLVQAPVTKKYPEAPCRVFERTRGHVAIQIEQCIFCGICSKKCPTHAIRVDKAQKTWEIERLQCIQCNSCVEQCPKKCLEMANSYTPPTTGSQKDVYHA
ncbi:MAG: 4Fe-4S binding protein [Cellulosilyticaceae bacterium]